MKKSDIRNGMHVITKGGEEYIIMSNVYALKQINDNNTAKVAMLSLDGGWMNFDQYDNDLCFRDTEEEACDDDYLYDIEEVYAPNYYSWTFESVLKEKNKNDFTRFFTRLWKRGVKKMTKAEIEAELGYEIEIVESED